MEFKSLIEKALAVRAKYAAYEKERYGREWSNEELPTPPFRSIRHDSLTAT